MTLAVRLELRSDLGVSMVERDGACNAVVGARARVP
jgi:hypothetical protein